MYNSMSRDQVKTWILANDNRFGTEAAISFARQLYDVMGENEQLRKALEGLRDTVDRDGFSSVARNDPRAIRDIEALSKKDSQNGL